LSSELDNLVEVITELVLDQLAAADGGFAPSTDVSVSVGSRGSKSGAKLLVVAGPQRTDSCLWESLGRADGVVPSVLDDSAGKRLPALCSSWTVESRTLDWSGIVSDYKAVLLFGPSLPVLASIANFGDGNTASAGLAVAALATGLPVFIDDCAVRDFRRRSSRLAGGFVRRFEELHQVVSSFGVEFGGVSELPGFLDQLGGGGKAGSVSSAPRSGGRDVITVEDVEAVRSSGSKRIGIAMGSIVTPLARQRAEEWGIEVVFQ